MQAASDVKLHIATAGDMDLCTAVRMGWLNVRLRCIIAVLPKDLMVLKPCVCNQFIARDYISYSDILNSA